MLTAPAVSVIVPSYNHARFLPKRLDSIFNQTYQDFEVILLDDCSTDNSAEVLRSYAGHPRVSHFSVNEHNSGSPFRQWKKGMALARAGHIWIAESDDWAENDFLEKLMPRFTGTTGLVYCRSVVVDENDEACRGDFYWPEGLDSQKWRSDYAQDGLQEIAECLICRNTIPAASACVLSRGFLGTFPDIEDCKYAGDWLFWIELLKNCRLSYCALPMNKHRLHGGTSRMAETKHNEAVRLGEYFRAIQRAQMIAGTHAARSSDYQWIFREIYRHRKALGLMLFWPPMPHWLRPAYCRYVAAALGRQTVRAVRTLVRFDSRPTRAGL